MVKGRKTGMDDVKNFANHMREDLPVPYDAMPDIALYMDQVLAFLSRKKVSSREGEELTSAMVNNYIKDGLVPRAHGKRKSLSVRHGESPRHTRAYGATI